MCVSTIGKKLKTLTRLKPKAKNMSNPSDSTNKSEVLCNQTCNASPCLGVQMLSTPGDCCLLSAALCQQWERWGLPENSANKRMGGQGWRKLIILEREKAEGERKGAKGGSKWEGENWKKCEGKGRERKSWVRLENMRGCREVLGRQLEG